MQFLIDISLPAAPNAEFFAMIPLQRAHVDKLMEGGTLLAYSLSSDRTRLWMIVNGESQAEVMEILSKFPMRRYFEPTIHPLMFHNTSQTIPLKVSLN